MVFELENFLPRDHKELTPEVRNDYKTHYLKTLEKYGVMKDQHNADALDVIADYFGQWFAGTKDADYYPERGLFIFGPKGTGKTMIMQIFSGLFQIQFIRVEDLTETFAIGGDEAFWQMADEYRSKHLIIDDICNERAVKRYGNSMPLYELLKKREFLWKYDRVFTFYTSNAKGRNEITESYDDTITSRILGSCDFIKLDGPDRRLAR